MRRTTAEMKRPGLFIAALACALALHGAAAAQSLDWNDISGPAGHSLLYELADGTLFAIDEDVLTRSFDGGQTWEYFPRPGGPILEFAARASTTVIAIQRAQATNYKQYYASYDRGATWKRIAVEGTSGVHKKLTLSVDGTPHGLYQVGAKMAVERLVDSAWQRMGVPSGVYGDLPGAPSPYTAFAIDAGGNLYIGSTADGIHSSRDSGRSWTKALPYRYVNSIAFGPDGRAAIATTPNGRTAGGVFVSADRGAAWTLAGLTDLEISGLEFNPMSDVIALGSRLSGSATTIYRLDAGVADWDSTEPFKFAYRTLHVAGSGRFIATSPEFGLNLSDDDGATWNSDGIRQQDLFSVATSPDGSLLAGTLGKGIFRTTNGGDRWERVSTAGTPDYFYTILHQDSVLLGGTDRGLYASKDNGVSWSQLTGALTPDGVVLPVYAVVTDGGGSVVIGTAAGIFRSEDRGLSWTPSGLGSSSINALAVAPDGVLYAATGEDGVFSSRDGGRTWASKGLAQPGLQTVAVSGAGQVYVGTASGVYYSTDAGSAWTRKIFTDGHVHSILFNGNFNVFAGTSSGLFVSSDAGRSWEAAGLDGLFVIALAYDPARSITAVIYKGGVLKTSQAITAVGDGPSVPAAASLSQNYPNPFNPVTTIGYAVPEASRVTLRVYDVLGRISETIVDGVVPPGSYETAWSGEGRPSGVYFYSISIIPEGPGGAGARGRAHTEIRKMVLLK
jgi:photosystem II stability/assembly factor-like uncharacterized protein